MPMFSSFLNELLDRLVQLLIIIVELVSFYCMFPCSTLQAQLSVYQGFFNAIRQSYYTCYHILQVQQYLVMQAEDIRYIVNPFQKIVNIIKPEHERLYNLLFSQIQQFIKGSQLPTLTALTSVRQNSETDTSAYSGVAGYTYALIRLAQFFSGSKMMAEETEEIIHSSHIAEDDVISQLKNKEYYLDLAIKQYRLITQSFGHRKPSRKSLAFYMSETCTWLCGMYLAFYANNREMFRQNQKRLLECYDYYKKQKSKMMNQLLYGTPGFLYTFLQLQKQFDKHPNPEFRTNFSQISKQLTKDIIDSGVSTYEEVYKTKLEVTNMKKQLPENFRLIYHFHKKEYLGGAHGLGGNINILLMAFEINQFRMEELTVYCRLLSKSIMFLLRHFINGNFSTSAGSDRIKLVHFCHGAPGIVTGLARFANMFPEDAIKMGIPQVLQKSLQHIWQYGILKKGFGLCHGISGNAYSFISPSIQKVFPQQKQQFLKKAVLFALLKQEKEVMKQIRSYNFSDRMSVGISDEPYSLMLGLAGDICFTIDVILGVGRFPGFDF